MTKVNPNNGNETKSDIFPCDLFKSDVIYLFDNNERQQFFFINLMNMDK